MLSKEVQENKRDLRTLKEAIELVEILVRGCFLLIQVGAQDADADERDALRECGSWSLEIFEELLTILALPEDKDETAVEWISSMGRGVASVLEVMKELPRPLPMGARKHIDDITSLTDGWLKAASAKQNQLATGNKEGRRRVGRAVQRAQDAYSELSLH